MIEEKEQVEIREKPEKPEVVRNPFQSMVLWMVRVVWVNRSLQD
jgi:hypothetical protein